jgi:hypothetical protein
LQRFRILLRSAFDHDHGMDPRVKPEDDEGVVATAAKDLIR